MSLNQPNPFIRPPPGLLCLCNTPEGGRVLKTTRRIKPGEIVMVDTPIFVYPSSLSCLSIFCSSCFRVLPPRPLHCAKCREARFCSNQCLARSHPGLLCHALSTHVSGTRTWPDDILFLLSAYSFSDIEILRLLTLTHSNSGLPDESIKTLHSELTSLVPANNVPKHFTRENTYALIGIKKNFSFALKSPQDPKYESCGIAGARAYGLYLWTSTLNHSCIPNVCRFNYVDVLTRKRSTDFEFRAFEEIKEGLEIKTSYVGVEKGYKERQNMLMECYRIKCDCRRCKIESQWKENKGEEEKNEEETTEGMEEMHKEEDAEESNKEGAQEEAKETNKEENENRSEDKNVELDTEVEGGVRGEEQEMLEGSGDNYQLLINAYIKRYICDCGGFLAPTPPSQDNGMEPNCMECNGCGSFTIYEPGDSLKALYN